MHECENSIFVRNRYTSDPCKHSQSPCLQNRKIFFKNQYFQLTSKTIGFTKTFSYTHTSLFFTHRRDPQWDLFCSSCPHLFVLFLHKHSFYFAFIPYVCMCVICIHICKYSQIHVHIQACIDLILGFTNEKGDVIYCLSSPIIFLSSFFPGLQDLFFPFHRQTQKSWFTNYCGNKRNP